MPHLHIISGTGAAVRRLLGEEKAKLENDGYEDVGSTEAGDWVTLLSENSGRGLWSDKSAVIVEEAERLGPLPGRLAPMLEGPGADNVILLVCKPDVSVVPKECAGCCTFSRVSSPPPWSKERDEIIYSEAKKFGVGISRRSVSMLKEMFEDIGELAAETGMIARVCSLRKTGEITAAHVEELCLSDGSRNMLKLLDGLCAGNCGDCMASLEDLSRRSEFQPLIAALHNRFRLAMYLAMFRGERAGVVRALGARDYAVRNAETAAKTYGAERLKKFVTGLVRITASDRAGRGADWRDLSLLVIELLSGAGQK
ncbi:MAG: hypothetical protein FWE55_03505 [Synergistaceae bacterium]|nr:hypothetical protein [Synergistaceae bacterium]